eukprot:m.118487 g.118487  ORF g.118487 m.118487 type:complete len:438 (+) comp13656_c0_seq1:46-1359(+)
MQDPRDMDMRHAHVASEIPHAMNLGVGIYWDCDAGTDDITRSSHQAPLGSKALPVRSIEKARELANSAEACRGIFVVRNRTQFKDQLLAGALPPCGNPQCKPCLNANNLSFCRICGRLKNRQTKCCQIKSKTKVSSIIEGKTDFDRLTKARQIMAKVAKQLKDVADLVPESTMALMYRLPSVGPKDAAPTHMEDKDSGKTRQSLHTLAYGMCDALSSGHYVHLTTGHVYPRCVVPMPTPPDSFNDEMQHQRRVEEIEELLRQNKKQEAAHLQHQLELQKMQDASDLEKHSQELIAYTMTMFHLAYSKPASMKSRADQSYYRKGKHDSVCQRCSAILPSLNTTHAATSASVSMMRPVAQPQQQTYMHYNLPHHITQAAHHQAHHAHQQTMMHPMVMQEMHPPPTHSHAHAHLEAIAPTSAPQPAVTNVGEPAPKVAKN